MKKWLLRIIWLPIMGVTVLFLFANRQLVSLSLDPVSASEPAITTPALPLWFWMILMLMTGFLMGCTGMWLSGRPGREKARADRKTVKALRKEVSVLEGKLAQTPGGADAEVPVLETTPA